MPGYGKVQFAGITTVAWTDDQYTEDAIRDASIRFRNDRRGGEHESGRENRFGAIALTKEAPWKVHF